MLNVAWLAATVLVVASTAMASNLGSESGAACALDAGADGTTPAADLPPPVVDWTPLHATPGPGIDFKDAAAEPGSVLPATLDRDTSHPLIPALLALGAMVVLLHKRPV
jgi:hypothetical protein